MSKRGDNIRKRKDNRWEGRYKKGRAPDGSLLYASVYGKTYREVREKLSALAKEPAKVSTPLGKEKTFGDVLNLWMTNNRIRLKGGTINKYQSLIDSHIMPELGCIRITEIDATRINSFLDAKLSNGKLNSHGGLSPSYVRSMMVVINAAIKYAVDEQFCLPLKSTVHKPAASKTELVILSREEQKKIETFLLSNFSLSAAGVFISLHTGMRIGEICGLSWDDVDLAKGIIKVRHTVARVKSDNAEGSKTKLILDTPKTDASVREIPISTVLFPVLLELKNISSKNFVISETREFMKPRTFEYQYHRMLNMCGIKPINFHALRHTFATRCVEVGVDIKSLSEILGHANVGITLNTYVHSSLEMKRVQLEKLASFSA